MSPVLDLLAENDNGRPDETIFRRPGAEAPRVRAALLAPLRSAGAVPPPSCRAWHTIDGRKTLTSILAVEWPSRHGVEGAPCWRASATIWGAATRERRDVALLLAQHLLLPLGEGPLELDVGPSTVLARRPLTARERAALVATRVAIA